MLYNLMNGNRLVLKFDLEDMYIEVIDNDFLPYELKDFVKTTESTVAGVKKTAADITVLKDFFISRTLNLTRENAKVILNVATLPQSLKTEEKLKIVLCCNGLSMTDNFWIKKDKDIVLFEDINLRSHKLSEASYDIAILGKYISATREELKPDLSTSGMFPKYWKRENGTLYLYKTDTYTNNISVDSELLYCKCLEEMGIKCVHYDLVTYNDRKFAISECISTDKYSLVHAQSVKDWCNHTGQDFIDYIETNFLKDFANMCVCDYVFANTDRHLENWGFLVDNTTNQIVSFAPLFDHNQSFISDYMEAEIDELTYESCNMKFVDAARKYFKNATADFSKVASFVNEKCIERIEKISEEREEVEEEDKEM